LLEIGDYPRPQEEVYFKLTCGPRSSQVIFACFGFFSLWSYLKRMVLSRFDGKMADSQCSFNGETGGIVRSALIVIVAMAHFTLSSCSRSEGGRERTIRESLDLIVFSETGVMIFDSVPLEDLRGVHLAGAGLLNHDVLVSGTVELAGAGGTYFILTDSSARMLVDTTRVSAAGQSLESKRGKTVIIHGEVKSGEKGHIYLLANAVRGG